MHVQYRTVISFIKKRFNVFHENSCVSYGSCFQVRSHVVIKTHAATGQRTAAGNVLNAVWDTSPLPSPSHSPTLPVHTPSTKTNADTAVSELDGISEARTVPELEKERGKNEEERLPKKLDSQLSSEQTEDVRQTFKRFGGSLLKKFSDG